MDTIIGILRREMTIHLRDGVRNGISEALRMVATIIVVGAIILICACISVLLR